MASSLNKNLITLIIVLSVIGIYFLSKMDMTKIIFIKLLKNNAIIEHYNDKGQHSGDFYAFINGKLYTKCYYLNDKIQGLYEQYYFNGKKDYIVNYKNGVFDGIERKYYENGQLNYINIWGNGKQINSSYSYTQQGTQRNYWAFDLSPDSIGDNGFCYAEYDANGSFKKVIGEVFSKYLYTKQSQKVILINSNKQVPQNVKDLYINIGTPPKLKTKVDIVINNKRFKKSGITKNTLLLQNVLIGKGPFKIKIIGILQSRNKIAKADTLNMTIFK